MRFVRHFLRRRLNAVGVLLVSGFVAASLLAPWLAPQPDPLHPSAYRIAGNVNDQVPRPPAPAAALGTTPGQLDIYYTLVWGCRSALLFGLTVAALAALLGTLFGALSGYAGGLVDLVLMRACDALISIPVLAGVWLLGQFVLPVSSLAQARNVLGMEATTVQRLALEFHLSPLIIGLVLFMWMPYARVINANVRLLRDAGFVAAARAVGMPGWQVLARHILPNAIGPVLVYLARDIGGVVVLAAAFTFVGVQGGPEWSVLMVISRAWILGAPGNPFVYWWVFVPPTLVLIAFNVAFNLIGDGLNTELNPRTA